MDNQVKELAKAYRHELEEIEVRFSVKVLKHTLGQCYSTLLIWAQSKRLLLPHNFTQNSKLCHFFAFCYIQVLSTECNWLSQVAGSILCLQVKVKECHIPKERRRGAHLPYIGRWVHRWIKHYCLWCMASATPDLRSPYQPKLVLNSPTHRGWPGWVDLGGMLHTEIVYASEDGHPSRH